MTKFKKVLAGTLAAVSIMSSALCVGASAYTDTGNWALYTNPNTSRSEANFNINYYTGGYRAFISSKGNGGASNYVQIFQASAKKAMLTEIGKICKVFRSNPYVDKNGNLYAPFKVTLYTEIITEDTAYNNGTIKTGNLF